MVVTPKLAAHRIKSESLIAASVTVAGYGKWPHPNATVKTGPLCLKWVIPFSYNN